MKTPFIELSERRRRDRIRWLTINSALGLACAAISYAAFWTAAGEAQVWDGAALGFAAGGAFAVLALVQLAPLIRAFVGGGVE